MRIALASIHPRPLSGQIEGLVGLAHALEKHGHAVDLVSAFPSEQLLGTDRLQLAHRPQKVLTDQPVRIARILKRLVRLGPQVDLIQLNLPTPAFSIVADLLRLLVRAPIVVGYEAHLIEPHELARRDRLSQAPGFYLPRLLINNDVIACLTLHSAAGYLVHTDYQKDELVRLGAPADRIHILPPVLPEDKLQRRTGEMRALFPPGRVVTYIGHYNHVKGVDVLVRAFQELAPRYPDLHLALAWSGVGSRHVVEPLDADAALRPRVFHLGQVEVMDLLAASDVVVLPYRLTIGQAAYPAMLMEALAARVPIVTTDLPVLRELTENGKTAMLVPPDDVAALAAGIESVLTQPSIVEEMRRAQQNWMQRVEPPQIVKEYERLYQKLAAPQAGLLRPARDR